MVTYINTFSLGQSHASATAGAWPCRVLYLSMWAFWGLSEIQTLLDVSDVFKGHEDLTSCSALSTVTCFRC